jgi:transposase
MRGPDEQTGAMFSYLSPEALVPPDHPLRPIRERVNATLASMSPAFAKLYSPFGRLSIPPEKLLRALLLQAFFGIRSERQLMEQISYNMLFRWFVGLSMDAPAWDVTVFTKNRDRLLDGDVARLFLNTVVTNPEVKKLLSNEHFSVDGTLIEAWASMKSFQPRMAAALLPARDATPSGTFTASGEATRRTNRRPIPTRGCIGNPAARARNSATSDIF